MPYRLHIISHGKSVLAGGGELLIEKIKEAGIDINAYCGKNGLCGKCFVEIVDGILPPLTEQEKLLLKQKKREEHWRLACQCKIAGDLNIIIPPESVIQETPVLTMGIDSTIPLDSPVKKYHIRLQKPEISSPDSILDIVGSFFRTKDLRIPLEKLRELDMFIQESHKGITVVLHENSELLDYDADDTTDRNFGVAVDLGTTTVIVEIVDLNTGEMIDSEAGLNPQIKHGADIISRIGYALSKSENLNELQKCIMDMLNKMIVQLMERNNINSSFVYEVVVAGNTAMNHILLGLPLHSLATAPFNAVFSCMPSLSSEDLGFQINRNGKVYIAPNIKSFVGGDVSSGLLASDLINKKGAFLYIDLGTNGEIVLATEGRTMATSAAAGPAFEGMNISCGMLASPGAIYRAEYREKLRIETIGGKPASGFCGSGLIDILAVFLDRKIISPKGAINNRSRSITVIDRVVLTQKDIRELQLATAAVKTGIEMMLQEGNLEPERLDRIYIAGAFGHYLNVRNAMRIGLLPQVNESKIVFIGNASLAGAKALLFSGDARRMIESFVNRIEYVSLASQPEFQKTFLENMEFKSEP